MEFVAVFIFGLAVGAAVVWFTTRTRTDHAALLTQLADAKLRESQQGAKADLTALLTPIQDQLKQLNEQTHVLEKNRVGAYENLRTLVDALKDGQVALQKETNNLSRALSSPNTRGRWGEKLLEYVLEMSGMTSYCGFTQQETLNSTDDGKARPDVIVSIPGNGKIAVDAKVPYEAFKEMIDAQDDATRAAAQQRHVTLFKGHIRKLSEKSYWDRLPSPQFVVMFVPGDNFLHSALEGDANLFDEAVAKNVLIATPVTLIALLKAVAYGWRQEKLAENAQQVSALGRELYTRLSSLAGHWQKVGAALLGATKAYNDSVGTLESRVLVTARKFEDYGAVESGADVSISPIDELAPRALTAPELTTGELAGSESDVRTTQEILRKLG